MRTIVKSLIALSLLQPAKCVAETDNTLMQAFYDGNKSHAAPAVIVPPQRAPRLDSNIQPRFNTPFVVPLLPTIAAKKLPVRSLLDAALDTLNPFALFNNKVLGQPHAALAPESLFGDSARGPIVGINGVSSSEPYLKTADFITGRGIAASRHAYQARANSPDRILDILLDIRRLDGPIRRLVIAAHGAPGSLNVGDRAMDSQWAQNADFNRLPRDLFVPGAEVILISCSVGYDTLSFSRHSDEGAGAASIRKIFSPLLKQGGTVLASTRYVDPELARVPDEYTAWSDRLVRHLSSPVRSMIEITKWLISDNTSRFHKTIRVDIPPS
jgi:hypothetical protein